MPGKLTVFLSHNNSDKSEVEALYFRLGQEADVKPWLDKYDLTPGKSWQDALESVIADCDVCCVFVGSKGFGQWHHEEMRALNSRRVSDRQGHFRVIPVLLPGAERGSRSSLPPFLVATTWVEFRHTLDDADAFRRLLCGIRGVPPTPPPGQTVQLGECPYRGLEYFDVPHAGQFFGREAVTQWLVDDIRKPLRPNSEEPRFLAILGASGSGKSSLARAGLYASLRGGAIEGSRDWLFVPPLRPGPNPLESLELAVLQAAAGSLHLESVRAELRELPKNPAALHRAARLLVSDTSPPRRLFLLVDQFEEVFTTCEKEELRRPFIAALLHAARERGGPVVVALTMRADFYPKVAAYEELARVVDQHQYLVGPMSEGELRLAIEEPATRAGAEFEPGLVDKLLEAIHRQPGGLPLLEHALKELWNKREDGRKLTHDAYKTIGGLEGALERRANEVFQQFNADDQDLCRRVFLRLVHPGEGSEDTKRRVLLGELLTLGDASRIQRLIAALTAPDARLIVTEGGRKNHPDQAFVEVAHETLIRSWSQLRKWLDADRAGFRTQRRLTEAAREWDEIGHKPEFLYSGGRLAVTSEWASAHQSDLTELEKDFLHASRLAQEHQVMEADRKAKELACAQEKARTDEKTRAEERETLRSRFRRFVITIGIFATLFLLAVILFSAITLRSELRLKQKALVLATNALAVAERNASLNQAQALVAEARQVRETLPLHSLLLASAAAETTRRRLPGAPTLPAAHQTMRDALANVGGWPLAGHGNAGGCLVPSPDGRWVATGSIDGTVRLWNLREADPAAQPLILRGHKSNVVAASFSPDKRWVVTGSCDHTARLWDLRATNPAAEFVLLQGHAGEVRAVAVSPDSRWVVTGSDDHTSRLWDLRAADPATEPLVLKGHEAPVRAVAFSPDNRWLATGSMDKTAILWNLRAADPATQPVVLKGHSAWVGSVVFSPDNRWVATASGDKTARLWNLAAADPAAQPIVLKGHAYAIFSVAFSADNRWLATASGDKTARLWNLTAADPAAQPIILNGHQDLVKKVAISANSRWAVTGSDDKTARLWDLWADDPAAQPVVLQGHEGWVWSVAFTPDNLWVVTGSPDSTARMWDLRLCTMSAQPLVLKGHEAPVLAVAFSPDNRWLATGSEDETVRLWDLSATHPSPHSLVLKEHAGDVGAVAFSPDNHWLVTGSKSRANSARLWNLRVADPVAPPVVLGGYRTWVTAVAFSPDSRWLVTDGAGNIARLWDLRAADPATQPVALKGHGNSITSVAFSPDNHWVVTGSWDKTARLWDLRAADPDSQPVVLKGHEGKVSAVAASPDGRWLVTGSYDQTARLWDLRAADPSAQPVVLKGHGDSITSVAFSLDKHWVVTGSWDKTARLWDLRAADPASQPIVLRGHEGWVNAVAFSPDSRWVVTGGADKTVRLYLLQIEDLMALAQRTIGRNLSTNEWETVMPGQPYFEVFPGLPIPKD